MPDKSRVLWLTLCLVGVVIVVVAAGARLFGGPPEDHRAVQASATTSTTAGAAPTEGADAPAQSGTPAATPTDPTAGTSTPAEDAFTAPPGWPDVELPAVAPTTVVDTFLDAVLEADCAKADEQLTPGFKQREGNCSTSGLVPDDVDDYESEVEEARPAKRQPVVIVPATMTYAGQAFRYQFELIIVNDAWKIRDVTE